MRGFRLIAALALILLVVANTPAQAMAGTGITVVVENLRSDKGEVRLARALARARKRCHLGCLGNFSSGRAVTAIWVTH